jgi:hypothetical protein
MLFIGIYLLIGLIICIILFSIKNIGNEIGFISREHLWIILGFLALFIMVF